MFSQETYRARLESARRCSLVDVNCHGTVLYLLRHRDVDKCATHEVLLEYLDPKPLETPEIGHVGIIVITTYKFIAHSGIVTSTDPVLLTHRNGRNKHVIEDEPADQILERYRKCNDVVTVEYRRPKVILGIAV